MSGRPGNKRPSLTRAETIDSCNSDDLVTVLEVHDRKPYKIVDRSREIKKGVMAESLDELIERGKEKLNYPVNRDVYVVLEEDGTEVDEEEYFQTLPENTVLMLLHVGDRWTPFGPPYTSQKKDKRGGRSAAVPRPASPQLDEVDSLHCSSQKDLYHLLERLQKEPGFIALMSGKQLELLAEMDVELILQNRTEFPKEFLQDIQTGADRHLMEKNEIRDAVGLLKLYHQAQEHHDRIKNSTDSSPRKRKKELGQNIQ